MRYLRQLLFVLSFAACLSTFVRGAQAASKIIQLTNEQQELLNETQKSGLHYFLRERNSANGLIRDWAWNMWANTNVPATVAGTGFALTAYGVGVERGWIEYEKALSLTKTSLRFLRDGLEQEHGFFYHFLTFEKGRRVPGSELSPIDTALALAGVLFAREYYDDPEIKQLADDLYQRVDWTWMLHGGQTFALAWKPESGFEVRRWTNFDESILMYLIALGSPTHPISKRSWDAIKRPLGSYQNYRLVQSPPLFTHQYPHIWFDLKNKHDEKMDYFDNSRKATLAQRAFAIAESTQYGSYGPDAWGLTASDGPRGYTAYGGPPGWVHQDGTVAPTACISSMPFTPQESLSCLMFLYNEYHDELWGRYGFGDSFQRDHKWYSKKVYAIDQGPIVLMIENFRSGLIWKVMNKSPYVQSALKRVGFQKGTISLKWPDPPVVRAYERTNKIQIDGSLDEWQLHREAVELNGDHYEFGETDEAGDLGGKIWFVWDETNLYFAAQIMDESLLMRRLGSQIFRDDLLEFFIDPQGDGLTWYGRDDFQIGFNLDLIRGGAKAWSWFQGGVNPVMKGGVQIQGRKTKSGYELEGLIPWAFLHFHPEVQDELRISPAVHDSDLGRSEAKMNWFFRNEEDVNRFVLGKLRLRESEEEATSRAYDPLDTNRKPISVTAGNQSVS